MITVANQPTFKNPTGEERMGEPVPWPGDPRLVTLLWPYNPNDPPNPTTYACWRPGGTGWEANPNPDDPDCHFQRSKTINSIEGERGGPLTWVITGDGLF